MARLGLVVHAPCPRFGHACCVERRLRLGRAPSDEERIAPLVAAQGCWGGVITFIHDQRKFEVEGCRCSDAQKYHLEFDSDLKLIAKRLVR